VELNEQKISTEDAGQISQSIIEPVPSKTMANDSKDNGPGLITNIIVSLLVSLMVITGGLYYYDKNYAQKIVTYDMVKSMEALRVLYAQGKLSDEQLKSSIAVIDEKISKSTGKNDIVFLKDVIIKGNIKEISQ
jgi:hypothetical protein